MIKVRKFQTEEQFNLAVLKYPTISYIKEIDKMHCQNNESYFTATINVTSTTYNTYFFGSSFQIKQVEKMYIDDVEITPTTNVKFDALGEHTVKCTFEKGALVNCNSMFLNVNFKTLDISHLDTSNVTTMHYMFAYATINFDLDLRRWNVSNVTTFYNMFYYTKGSFNVNISGWDAHNVTNINYMFANSSGLIEVNASNVDFSSVKTSDSVFNYTTALTKVDFSNVNLSSSTSCQYMFSCCYSLKELNLTNMNVQNVQTIQSIFHECSGLTSLDLSTWNTNSLSNASSMFYCCFSLKDLKLMKYTSNLTNVSSMFNWCHSLTKIDLSGLDFTKVSNMNSMFYSNNETQLKEIDFTCDMPTSVSYGGMFSGLITEGVLKYKCEDSDFWENVLFNDINSSKFPTTWKYGCVGDVSLKLKIINGLNEVKEGNFVINNTVGTYNSENDYWEFNYQSDVIKHDVYLNDEVVGNIYNRCKLQYLFIGEVDENYSGFTITEKINVTSVKSNYKLINEHYSNKLKSLLVDGEIQEPYSAHRFKTEGEHIVKLCFDNGDNTSLSGLFDSCYQINEISFNNFDTSNVTYMSYMFNNCSGLTSIDLSSFDTSNVTDMSYMFKYCNGLTSLDLSSLDTSNVTDMNNMFKYCSGLTSLDLSNFNTSNVTDMGMMFSDCSTLTSLDLSNFNTSNVTDMDYMFYGCSGLTSLIITSDISKVTLYTDMFRNITTTGTLTYNCAYEDAWTNILVTNQSKSKFPSTWTSQCE